MCVPEIFGLTDAKAIFKGGNRAACRTVGRGHNSNTAAYEKALNLSTGFLRDLADHRILEQQRDPMIRKVA